MKIRGRSILVLALVALMASLVAAQDENMMPADSGMPQFGPPEQLKQMESMIGDWHYAGQMKMSPEADWITHEAEVTFSFVAGGAAVEMTFVGDMMGMEMHGINLFTYDRETKMWQDVWVDNFAARVSMSTGTFENGKMVMSGKDLMNGQEILSRTTMYDITDKEFKWMMENSMDGKDWFISMRGMYTKK